MKKVAVITNIPSPYRVDLFNYLANYTNYDFTIIYSSTNEDNRNWKIDKYTLKHNYIFLESKTIKIKKKNDNKYIHIPFNITKVLGEIQPDIVIGSEYNPTVVLAYKWAKKHNKKYISWSDGTLNSDKNINLIQKFLRKKICKNSDACIASSSKTKEAQIFYGAKSEKIFISYLTVDINKYLINKNEYDNKNIIYVGRLIKLKGLDLLFNALKDIKNEFTLNIVGDGEEKEDLKELAKKLNIYNKVNFLGFKQRDEVIKYYQKSDLFILPTREDCFGLVITEAMCAGLPVIVSKYADGAYDLVDEGKNGFIVDPYNSKEFKEKIEVLLNSKDIIKNMGKNSQEKVKKFSLENVSKGFVDVIEYSSK